MVVVMLPIMPVRFEGTVAVPIMPMGMAAIGRIAIATITIAEGRAVMAAAGEATAQAQHQEQQRNGQGD